MALGAPAQQMRTLILRDSAGPVAAGLIGGIVAAIGTSTMLRSVLYGVATIDGVSFAGVPALLLAAALFTAYPRARGASGLDPNVALRHEA
jgi:putative ABC transport system permease protein